MSDEAEPEIPAEIRGLLVPLSGHALLLPNAAAAEIIDLEGLLPVPGMPDWYAGIIDWRQRRLPVVRFEYLLGEEVGHGQRQRIVVCHSLSPGARYPFIGIVAAAIPHLVRVREEMLQGEALPEGWSALPLRAALRVAEQPALIPDLPELAARLSELGSG